MRKPAPAAPWSVPPEPFSFARRGAAVVQMLGGRTRKGKAAQLAWGFVHLALMPTNADRAKAIVSWAGAGLTHQRTGRIIVRADA